MIDLTLRVLNRTSFRILDVETNKGIPVSLTDASGTAVTPTLMKYSDNGEFTDFDFSSSDEGVEAPEITSGAVGDWGEALAEGNATVWIPFTKLDDRLYNYAISGNTWNSNRDSTNLTYYMNDQTATGTDRVWTASSGYVIKWIVDRWAVVTNASVNDLYNNSWTNQNSYIALYASNACTGDEADLSELTWNVGYWWSGSTINIEAQLIQTSGQKTIYLALGYQEGETYHTSNIVSFTLATQANTINSTSYAITGPTGNKYYAGFYITDDGRFVPTRLLNVQYSASCDVDFRAKTSGITIAGIGFDQANLDPGAGMVKGSAQYDYLELGSPDAEISTSITFQDEAGNSVTLSQNIAIISKLWRLGSGNIKEDDTSYQTVLYSVNSASTYSEIPKTTTSSDDFTRQWEDIFYPTTHGYPVQSDGTIDYAEALRISKTTIDETGSSGPTSEELTMYDRLQLSTDGNSLAVDSDDRYMTSGWTWTKEYSRMESSSFGTAGENLRYWIIDNGEYGDMQLEFEYFDLDSNPSNIPPNMLSPYDGDVLVIYDAQAEGCLAESVDIYGNKTYSIADSSKLVEIYAFTGSRRNESDSIRVLSSNTESQTVEQSGTGFTTPSITSTNKICMILYSDNANQASGFKLKAGPRHNITISNYDINATSGEVWVHQEPGSTMTRYYSPSKMTANYQYLSGSTIFDYEQGAVILDSRSGQTITGDYTCYLYLYSDGTNETPTGYFFYTNANGVSINPTLTDFALYYDDCVDYLEVSLSAVPSGTTADFTSIYSFQNPAEDFGKITTGFTANKDKGVITFSDTVPLGRIMANYTYHTFYRLTSDGYGDLYFYDTSLVPSSDYTTTGLKDWTYVDLMVYNEGSNSLTSGILTFMARGYVESSGSTQTVTQVVDENRPWDVQSGTTDETVSRTGGYFSSSFASLTTASRDSAINCTKTTISMDTMLARSKAYFRVFWTLATGSSSYVTTTRGSKLWSSELSGRYYVTTE